MPPQMTLPLWVPPLSAVLLMQVVAAFQSQSISVVGPVLTHLADVAPERIGELTGLVSLGSAWFFLSGNPLMQRLGSLRTLQLGAMLASVCLLAFFVPSWPLMMLAALLLGVGYAPTAPAGSDVLARYTPPQHRTAMFSIKQAGAPLGGAIGGLLLPSAVDLLGWPTALVVTALAGLVAALAVQRLRCALDADRDRSLVLSARMLVSPANLSQPVRALALAPRLPLLTSASFCFAAIQGNLFAFGVTFLNHEIGLTLVQAGVAASTMLLTGMVGRVVMGWIADRLGSALSVLRVLAVGATLTALAFATIAPSWSYAAILAVFAAGGVAATTWNGVFLAEVARIAPPGKVGVATAGSAFITFLAYTFGPMIFGRVVSAVGAYGPVFAGIAVLGLVALATLIVAERR